MTGLFVRGDSKRRVKALVFKIRRTVSQITTSCTLPSGRETQLVPVNKTQRNAGACPHDDVQNKSARKAIRATLSDRVPICQYIYLSSGRLVVKCCGGAVRR